MRESVDVSRFASHFATHVGQATALIFPDVSQLGQLSHFPRGRAHARTHARTHTHSYMWVMWVMWDRFGIINELAWATSLPIRDTPPRNRDNGLINGSFPADLTLRVRRRAALRLVKSLILMQHGATRCNACNSHNATKSRG